MNNSDSSAVSSHRLKIKFLLYSNLMK